MQTGVSIDAPKRCAIYTRKSAEAPLGQQITSLESQRAICSAYILSQQHKGWIEIPKPYEDAARTGAHLSRPALQELLADIELGLVDTVLVYKLDRITRTLLDFVRLVDFFDRYGVVFVSITQNFDTGDSMGRLIRNVLLTFAQFEREIAGDRIRDKKLIMKQRGLWTGGDAPLGYDLRRGKLLINAMEEPAVQAIYSKFLETERMSMVHRHLNERGFRRKTWTTKSGGRKGGGQISLSSLHRILSNPIYAGDVSYRWERFPGIHRPIIDRPTWERAQEILKEREQFKPRLASNLLTDILYDPHGRRMHARLTWSGQSLRRIYISATMTWANRQKIRKTRLQADQVEKLVLETLRTLLHDRSKLRPLLLDMGIAGPSLDRLADLGPSAASRFGKLSVRQLSVAIKGLLSRVEVASDCLRLVLRLNVLVEFLDWDGVGLPPSASAQMTRQHSTILTVPVVLDRSRRKSYLPIEPKDHGGKPCSKLVSLLQEARVAQQMVFSNRQASIPDLANSVRRKPGSFSRLIRLNYLAPDIMTAILDGAQPSSLTRRQLMTTDLPLDWALQRRLLGFDAAQKGAIPTSRPHETAGIRTERTIVREHTAN